MGRPVTSMQAWAVVRPGPVGSDPPPLAAVARTVPEPGPGEVLVRVLACGLCRTDLHLTEGDLPPRRPGTVPGHQVVGDVVAHGEGADRFARGTRIGIAWLRHTCGTCRYCTNGRENLCLSSRYTGWDADGGFAEFACVPEAFAYALPSGADPVAVAPLLCAGIIGYRALRRARLPKGGRLGIYGFGASAHLTAQVALAQGATVHVMTRAADARRLARELGAASAQGAYDAPPEPLDSAIVFAPVGDIVPAALEALDAGGTCAVAGIHLTDIPALDYERHLFRERTLCSVTSNTRLDGEEFLRIAAETGIHPTTTVYGLSRTYEALADLAADRMTGAGVVVPGV